MSNLLKREKGFTLIEIVLVLAIAGLLLVIVFLAVQGAQRSRRDSNRQQDAARALAGMEQCAANNNGSYTNPTNCATTLISSNYMNPATIVGGGGTYTVNSGAASITNLIIANPGTCGGTLSVSVGQEAGAVYCVHN